jgi:HK97 family phage major capsid protein
MARGELSCEESLMYEDSCPHGYIPSSCAECRQGTAEVDAMGERFERYLAQHKDGQRAGWLTRRSEITGRLAELEGYARRSNAQDEELHQLTSELTVLGSLIDQDDVRIRSEKLDHLKRLAADPANCEAGYDPGHREPARPSGSPAPALIGDRNRAESAADVLSRMRSNPWRAGDGSPLAGHTTYGVGESGQGLISRAHTALEGLESKLTRDGCQKLAEAFAESAGWPGMTVKRSKDEQAQAADLFLALSDPWYHQAFRSVLRYPSDFMAGGTGYLTWTDEERLAWMRVRQNEACRAAFAESSGATGAFALPLQLDPSVMIINAGAATPHRRLARTVIGTSNVWEGVTSQGTTANWYAEAAVVTDTTPSIAQVAITPYRESVWITGSLEVTDDTTLDEQVPALIDEARFRLEATAFATGTGSTQPYGLITRGASDATTGALSAAQIYGLLQNLGPRFRVYDSARPVWMANVAIINAARQLPAFTGAVNSIVNDQTDDGIPEMLGIDFMESSAMTNLNTTGAKNLLLADMSQYIIVDRQPNVLIFEPLFKDQATGRPAGQRGWFSYARVGADLTTPAAAYGSNAAVYHTV